MKHLLLAIILCHVFIFGCATTLPQKDHTSIPAGTFYVAPNGNDQWSGMLRQPNFTGKDGPFATLQKVRDEIRKLKKEHKSSDFKVLVRGGIYHLNETFVLGPEDSGTESHPLVIRAYGNERPILRGTRRITKFKPYKDGIFRADLRGTNLSSNNIRQLFAAGKRQILARFPNFDPNNPIGGGFLYIEKSVEEGSKIKFMYRDGSINNWTNPENAEVFIYPGPNYWNNILPVREIDRRDHIITLSQNASYAIRPGNRYYFQNILDELDSPGEWYFERREGALYYWPIDGSSLEYVEIPVLKSIVEIGTNKKGEAPANIHIEGFTMEGCEGTAVLLSGSKNILIAGNEIFNAGGHGIEVMGGSQNAVIGNDICEVGGAGIVISGGDRKTLTPGGNRAENNHIHNTGLFSKVYSGIECQGVGNVVSHNLIYATPRAGIRFDGNDHLIEYNHVHHVNQETQDSGVITSCARDWTKRGNVVQFNYVHDSGGYGRNNATEEWKTPFYTWGIYLDDWTSGTKVYGNIIARTFYGGVVIHGGKDNNIENNIIEEGETEQVRFQAIPVNNPMLPDMFNKIKEMGYTKYPQLFLIRDAETGAMMSGNQFQRNIIYYTDKKALLYNLYNIDKNIDLMTTVWDYNTIYHAELPLLIPFTGAPAVQQWQAWKEKGLDKNSVVADPLFKDIANENFELLPDSPALKYGFKPIPIDKIGPYKHPFRVSWPIENNSFNLTEGYAQ